MESSRTKSGIECLLRPGRVAIIGISARPGSAGQIVLNNLRAGGYRGQIYLVGRSGGEIGGLQVLTEIGQLPAQIDLAILMVPAEVLRDSVRQCVERQIGGAIAFASGFAELGEVGRAEQIEIGEIARQGNLALLGPNTVGYFNFVDSFHVMMVDLKAAPALPVDSGPTIAVVAQSGGLAAHVSGSLQARGLPISYMMATGNEASVTLADIIAHLAEDLRTAVIAVYAEQVLSADSFLRAVRKARSAGKRVVLFHPGKSEKGQATASSHTGALAGNHAAMRLISEQSGVLVVDSLEELVDLSELLLRFPEPQTGGLGILTGSGAICVLTQDYIEALGVEMPTLGERTVAALRETIPAYLSARNPLDVGTIIGWQPELLGKAAAHLLSDVGIGSLVVSLPMADAGMSIDWMQAYLSAYRGSLKPAIYVIHQEDRALAPQLLDLIRENKVVLMRSHERALRALAQLERFAEIWQQSSSSEVLEPFRDLPSWSSGNQPEWLGKATLAAMGIRVPRGTMAKTLDEAVAAAGQIGYPVVVKAQAASLVHKSDAGGVLLNINDEPALRGAWDQLQRNVKQYAPGLALDGVLVEAMGPEGLELVVGATRDPQWGPLLMVGLGGVWIEALGDVRLLPPDAPRDRIARELNRLKAHKLLQGFRGSPPVDVDAVASVALSVGRLMRTQPDVLEVDINPLVAYPRGQGVMALDALIVTRHSTGQEHG